MTTNGLRRTIANLLLISGCLVVCRGSTRPGFVSLRLGKRKHRVPLSQSVSKSSASSLPSSNTKLKCASLVNTTVTFPSVASFAELMVLAPGAFVESDVIPVTTAVLDKNDSPTTTTYNFKIKLYPRGGATSKKGTGSGFGMSYKVLPPLLGNQPEEKVGIYLQYLPNTQQQQQQQQHHDGASVDCSFALRLLGRQANGPRFDVEWRAGMRFCTAEKQLLASGRANDFGAHLMQTSLLAGFLGIDEDNYFTNKDPIQVQVDIQLHERPLTAKAETKDRGGLLLPLRDIRSVSEDKISVQQQHDTEQVRVGRVVVPVLTSLSQRQDMFNKGAYPGVEYRILRIVDAETQKDIFYSQPGCNYDLKPIYPLVAQLERPWPVTVNERDIPKLFSPNQYNVVSAIGSLLTAATGLLAAFVLSQAVSLFYIPSRSMDPTLEVGDVLLVEKVSPRLVGGYHAGDVILFSPPDRLREIVSQSGGRVSDRDLFVKRIAAEPGDSVAVDPDGSVQVNGLPTTGDRNLCTAEPLGLIKKYIKPTSSSAAPTTIAPNTVTVLGDCSSVSIDSRVWGALPTENIVGRPLVRLWPLGKFGPVPDLPPLLVTSWSE